MARRKSKMTVGARYVGIGALTELIMSVTEPGETMSDLDEARELAAHLIDGAWDVEHFPVAGKVQITLDLGRLDQPAEQPGPDADHQKAIDHEYDGP